MHPNNRHIQTHNFAGFISFAEVGGGGGGGLIEEKPCEDVRNAATTSYSGDIVNHYTYQGRKLGKKVYNSQHTLTVDEAYYDELMLSFGVPSRISHADGYVVLDKHGAIDGHYFYLKDHLGNVRSVLTPDQNNQPTVVQANDYYPFGMSYSTAPGANKFMYNSKEEQEMPGKWLDNGARFYDSQLGRWHSVDKLAEHPNQISQTPYQYAWNTPVNLNDPDGNCPWCIIGAVVGAAVDYGSQVAVNYATGKESPLTNVSGASIVTSAIVGAASGGLASVARSGAITTTRAVTGSMAINAGESISKQMGTEGTVNPTQVIVDVAAGQIADGINTKNLVPTNQLERKLDRAIRVAGENPRASRAEAVNVAQGKVNAANNVNQANSAAQAEVVKYAIGATGGVITSNNSGNNTPSRMLAPVSVQVDNTRFNLPTIPKLR